LNYLFNGETFVYYGDFFYQITRCRDEELRATRLLLEMILLNKNI